MSSLIAVRQSGPIGARTVETIILAQGAAFDLSGDIADNTTHRQGDGSDHADVADNTTHRQGDGSDHADVALNNAHRALVGGENPHGTDKTGVGLGNVTNDAQLKRSAGDFQAFTQKINIDGTESLISEDGSDGENKKRITLTGIYAWLKSLFSSIDYANPIVLTGAISPSNGQVFTTDSGLLTLTGSGGEKFWPAGGATSRIIWGNGVAADLPVAINPVNLGVGGVFEIAMEDGESRKIRYDGTDFIKYGGVEIPMSFYAYANSSQDGLATNTYEPCELDVALKNIGGTFDAVAYTQTIKRPASWLYSAFVGVKPTTSGTLERALVRMAVNTVLSTIFMDGFPVAASVGISSFIAGSTANKIDLAAGDEITLNALGRVSSSTWRIFGSASPSSNVNFSGNEVVQW